VFSTFFGSWHHVRLLKIWQRPYLAKMTMRGTLRRKKTKKGSKLKIWWHPYYLFKAPLYAVVSLEA